MAALLELFVDVHLQEKIRHKLPMLFALAEREASRAGRVGMEIGTIREQILVALLVYKFGSESVDLNVPINEPEVDVILCGRPLSIKTVTTRGSTVPGVKVVWTVDRQRVSEFVSAYRPNADMLLVIIRWDGEGRLYAIPKEVQEEACERGGWCRHRRRTMMSNC